MMRKLHAAGYICLFFFLFPAFGIAQQVTDSLRHPKVYVNSGMGWGFALGETSDVLQAKFSSSLGLDISTGNRNYFIYPSVDFLTFRYNQQVSDPDYSYTLDRGRSNFYILNLAAGARRQLGLFHVYAFAGPGIGVVTEPRAAVSPEANKVSIENTTYLTPTLRGGAGADYQVGGFFLFIEAGWLHNFRQIQQRPVNILSVYGGLKTDVTRLKDNVARIIGVD